MTLKAAMKEKTAMKRAIATTVFVGALVLMLAMCARARSAPLYSLKTAAVGNED